MPMNNSQSRLGIDPLLTKLTQKYHPNTFNAGSALFPTVDVQSRTGRIPMWGKEAFQLQDTERAPGTVIKQINFAYSSDTFSLLDHALDSVVPVETMQEAGKVPKINLALPAVQLTMDNILLTLEKEKSDLSTDVGVYGGNSVTLSGTAQWSDTNSDPLHDIDVAIAAIEDAEGVTPNVCVMSVLTYRKLKAHPKVQDYCKRTNRNVETLKNSLLAEYFGVDKVVVTTSHYTDANGNNQYLWAKDVVLAYVNHTPLSNQVRSYGYTYRLENMPYVEKAFYDRNRHSWIYGTKDARKPYLTSVSCGFLIKNAIA